MVRFAGICTRERGQHVQCDEGSGFQFLMASAQSIASRTHTQRMQTSRTSQTVAHTNNADHIAWAKPLVVAGAIGLGIGIGAAVIYHSMRCSSSSMPLKQTAANAITSAKKDKVTYTGYTTGSLPYRDSYYCGNACSDQRCTGGDNLAQLTQSNTYTTPRGDVIACSGPGCAPKGGLIPFCHRTEYMMPGQGWKTTAQSAAAGSSGL